MTTTDVQPRDGRSRPRPGSAHNLRAAKLTADDVHRIRALIAARFSSKSIAAAFNVTSEAIYYIRSKRRWWHLPEIQIELPILPVEVANRLRVQRNAKLSREQKIALLDYRKRLEGFYEYQAAAEGVAIERLHQWTKRRG